MTFSEYYFNGSTAWYDVYIREGEEAYIEMYGLEEEVKEMEELDRYVWCKQNNK